MLREAVIETDVAPTWVPENGNQAARPDPGDAGADWRTVDRALRAIARRRAGLDAEEARWLREAEALQIWRPLGMVSALDYLERVLGYAPRAAQERLRVARALGSLPELAGALTAGTLPFSAIRELTRVARSATEAAWLAAAQGKNLRQIEELVAGHRPGDRPDDPPDPEARIHVLRLELAATTFAQLRQARGMLEDERGAPLSDDELIAALCNAVLDGEPTGEPTGRAKYQIAVTVCERCRQGWQDGAGARVAIEAGAVERALCDAQHIGSLDGEAPGRASQDVPPSVVRFVWRRDGGRCRVPGCRSARGLEIHHLVHRSEGGSHDPSNLALLCSACHLAHHRGSLAIRGTADQIVVHRPGAISALGGPGLRAPASAAAERAAGGTGTHVGASPAAAEPADAARTHVGAPPAAAQPADAARTHVGAVGPRNGTPGKLDAAVLRTQGKQALVAMGWKPRIANAAVDGALGLLGAAAPLERIVVEALRRCPRPIA